MNDSLGDRMKNFYEGPARHYLTRRTPVIVRLDGRAFHTLTKGFQKPYDASFIENMDAAARCLFDEMQGCKMAYIQSDEASFVLTDYDTLTTEAWFGYNKSKVESISAATMSVYFTIMAGFALPKPPVFDARAFNIPESEVANYFLWRAKDWHRNSIQMLAQHNFTHKELQGKSIQECLAMLEKIKEYWDQRPDLIKNGTFLIKREGVIHTLTNVRDTYKEIEAVWNEVNPTDEPEDTWGL
jgi:tRNA(His) 5'-end guanylyltransferase